MKKNELFLYRHSVSTSVQTKFEIELAEVACQSLKQKDREVRFDIIIFED